MSSMSLAFESARIAKTASNSLIETCLDALVRYLRRKRKAPPGWKANLSFKTYRYLTNKGVPVQ